MNCQIFVEPFQIFPGGSALGNTSNTQVPMNTVDIGLPQLAMHSPYETARVKDTWSLIKAAEEFFRLRSRLLMDKKAVFFDAGQELSAI